MVELQPVYLSIKIALASVVVVFILGLVAAVFMRRCQFAGKAAVRLACASCPLPQSSSAPQ